MTSSASSRGNMDACRKQVFVWEVSELHKQLMRTDSSWFNRLAHFKRDGRSKRVYHICIKTYFKCNSAKLNKINTTWSKNEWNLILLFSYLCRRTWIDYSSVCLGILTGMTVCLHFFMSEVVFGLQHKARGGRSMLEVAWMLYWIWIQSVDHLPALWKVPKCHSWVKAET